MNASPGEDFFGKPFSGPVWGPGGSASSSAGAFAVERPLARPRFGGMAPETDPPVDPQQAVIRSPLPYSPKFGCAIGLLCITVMTFLGAYFIYTGFEQNRRIDEFTVEKAAPPPVTYSDAERVDELRRSLQAFAGAVQRGESAELALTAQDLNDLIGHESILFDLREVVVFTGIGDALEARISLPMRTLFRRGRFRYLNGSARFRPVLGKDRVGLEMVEVRSDDGSVPAGFAEFIATNADFLRPYLDNPEIGPVLRSIDAAELASGEIRLHSRP